MAATCGPGHEHPCAVGPLHCGVLEPSLEESSEVPDSPGRSVVPLPAEGLCHKAAVVPFCVSQQLQNESSGWILAGQVPLPRCHCG